MKSLLIALALGGLFLTGCSRSGGIPESQRLRNAPTEDSKTGILVLGAQESVLADMATEDFNIYIRPINKAHGIYEVHGASNVQLREKLGPNVKIHQNQYRKVMPSQASDAFNIFDFSFQDDFINSCRNFRSDKNTFEIKLQNKLDKFEISHIYELGDMVDAQFVAEDELQYLWKLDPPKSSDLQNMTGLDHELQFKPDTNGEFLLTVIAKNKLKDCIIQKKSIYVTANPELDFDSRLSLAEKEAFDLDGFWHLEFLGLPALWEVSTGEDVVIAIIDTGVNYNHESLNENIFVNSSEIPGNGIDDDLNGYVDDSYGYDFSSSDAFPFDDNGHGTHVAGLAAAVSFGIAKDAKIMPLKTLTGLGTDTGSFVGAIYYAVDNGADIINASFGWKTDHPIFRQAMEYARDKGVLVVTASGNSTRGIDNDKNPSYPTNYDHSNILSVAAVDEDNDLAPYSNYGAHSVDIASFGGAPWLKLFSTSHKKIGGRAYTGKSGTSQATPIVAGAAALMLSRDPSLSALDIKSILLSTAKTTASLNGKILSNGVLDLGSALSKVTRPLSSH